MTIQHKDIPDAQLHEPKGIAAEVIGKVYFSNGAGSGNWLFPDPHGSVTFVNLAAPVSITFPSVYTKVNMVSVASAIGQEVTEGTNSRLTYTGTLSRPFRITGNLYLDQTAGALRDIRAALYKNGSIIASSESITTTTSSEKVNIVLFADTLLNTNDFLEIYVRNEGASGDVRIYTLMLATTCLGRTL